MASEHVDATKNTCITFPIIYPDSNNDLVFVSGGYFGIGSNEGYPEETPVRQKKVNDFYISNHEVTNGDFLAFVEATGYVTQAEKGAIIETGQTSSLETGAAVFQTPTNGGTGWSLAENADWRAPNGDGRVPDDWLRLPVVNIAFEDAKNYALWLGRDLPTEAEWEYAAKKAKVNDSHLGDRAPVSSANIWQGLFPVVDSGRDGHKGLAKVGCYPADELGLYDMIGNVWEWTQSSYFPRHDTVPNPRSGFDPAQPGVAVKTIKGGSYLCARNWCQRYRASSRHPQDITLGTNHIGFRTVKRTQ
ncbi:gliding motility-associated lipoprotein GldK [Veronia nyctiphanis]|uniref:Gliding motility-associated lipoprotein GldK n=1 Tax=Veronia nyctiphanis TaxID=1278244 RepID=A0A4Q0YHN0_9GAMM|nr:formylglycine-generating enzyme family protein [Veronia nyctiphanis]RXJ69815.1 gliding motility-associated lipoprotein GldK [Veronia nyctiphanis]